MKGNLRRDDNAGVVGNAALSVASLFFIAIMIIAFTANPVAIGIDVGERAPDVEEKHTTAPLGLNLILRVTLTLTGKKVINPDNGLL